MSATPTVLRHPLAEGRDSVDGDVTAAVVGGGIAGLAAATILSERGVRVAVLERESFFGGRAGSWPDRLASGEAFHMERGFHAFFRQYYTLRDLLRRVDPDLAELIPLEDYPIHGPEGAIQSFQNLPTSTPANLIDLVRRSPAIGLRDLLRVNKTRALEMLTYDGAKTYARRDSMTAREYLDSLSFPPTARRLFFDVFAHSFFNPEEEMSAAELLMMFHFYFTGNPEGLVFDVSRQPFSKAFWDPLCDYLTERGTELRPQTTVTGVARSGDGWRVTVEGSAELEADAVVLALPVPAVKEVVGRSEDLTDRAWRRQVESLEVTNPFVVWRIWLDRPVRAGRAPFVGTTGFGLIDNISLYHLFEDESREWVEATGGAVVELHAYAVPHQHDSDEVKADLLGALHRIYPETAEAKILEERYLVMQDCPGFAPGSDRLRPGVQTPYEGLTLAGDFVKLPFPSALMERATASGFLAANTVLAAHGVRSEPVRCVPSRGLLNRLPRVKST